MGSKRQKDDLRAAFPCCFLPCTHAAVSESERAYFYLSHFFDFLVLSANGVN